MPERRSALAECVGSGRDGRDGQRRVRIGERRGWSLWQVADFPGSSASCARELHAALGADPPVRAGVVARAGEHRILMTGAGQYWIITRDEDAVRAALQDIRAAGTVAVTSLSHSRTCIVVEGPGARDLLSASVPLDLHPDAFAVNAYALTGIHHTPVLLLRDATDAFEVYALRTYARFVWDHLLDSALPYGFDIVACT